MVQVGRSVVGELLEKGGYLSCDGCVGEYKSGGE